MIYLIELDNVRGQFASALKLDQVIDALSVYNATIVQCHPLHIPDFNAPVMPLSTLLRKLAGYVECPCGFEYHQSEDPIHDCEQYGRIG